jgi:cellulose synthase/poly-beta-1,6-N-acetylglucosamine synthase-like glycosyltransferase
MILWFVFCFLSFGVLGLNFLLLRRAASRPWRLRMDGGFSPKVSILVPTYNEASVVFFKLENVNKLNYPKALTQIIVVDSKSEDGTVDIVRSFQSAHPEFDLQIVEDPQRKGKSAALNLALKYCQGDVVVVSDADCFWPADILSKTLPFLSDPSIGAVTGPKMLLNGEQSWSTKTEDAYLSSMNLMKLGESKTGSTLFFEGGFSAYRREALNSFDPYATGSDDCGTIIALTEKQLRAILVPEALFYTAFPVSWREKVGMKMRRANQLGRVFWKYLTLLLDGKIKGSKRTIISNIFTYLFSPIFFILLLPATALVIIGFPFFAALLLLFLVPKIRGPLIEASQSFIILILGYIGAASRKSFLKWQRPADRLVLTSEMLRGRNLI